VEGEAVAPQPGGLGGRPPRCRATGPPGVLAQIFRETFAEKPLPLGSGAARCRPPGSGAAGVYSCKFRKQKYIFVKNEIEKYKNKKSLSSWHTEARNEESKKRPISFSPPPLLLSVFPRRLPDSPRVRFRGSRRWPRCALSPTRRAPRLPTPRAAASLPHTPVPPATAQCAPLHLALPGRRKQQAKP